MDNEWQKLFEGEPQKRKKRHEKKFQKGLKFNDKRFHKNIRHRNDWLGRTTYNEHEGYYYKFRVEVKA